MYKLLRKNKGFTLVELIVVIAIIGILAAIMIPLAGSSGKSENAIARAKSFYYAVQGSLLNMKAAMKPGDTNPVMSIELSGSEEKPTRNGTSVSYMLICAKGVQNEGFTEMVAAVTDGSTSNPPENQFKLLFEAGKQVTITSANDDKNFLSRLNSYFTTEDEGYYYAMIDPEYRVVAAYWSKLSPAEMDQGIDKVIFTDDYQVDDNVYCGAFPARFGGSAPGVTLAIFQAAA